MSTLSREIERAKVIDQPIESFGSDPIRAVENITFEKGDVFTFPKDYKERIYGKKLGSNVVPYLLVEVTEGPNKGNALAFYPSTFTKSRAIYNQDKTPTGKRMHTMGNAAEFYRKYNTVNEGMEALKGKTVKFTKVEMIQTLAFGGDQLMPTQIPTIDFVEK